MSQALFAFAAAGGTVLTANKRLARCLIQQFDQYQSGTGLSVWPTPKIFSLEAWCLRQLQQLRRGSNLLTDGEAHHIWEEIVAADATASGHDLLQVPPAARRARAAHLLLSAYQADVLASEANEDQLAFLRWRSIWQERQRRAGWLDRGELVPVIISAVIAGQAEVPHQLLLAGFDELTPAVQRLCDELRCQGCRLGFWAPPVVPFAAASVYAAVDRGDEVRMCARWARNRLEQEPQARIGVVAANLDDYQGLIERIFRAELDPSACHHLQDGPEAFTLSLGTPLARDGVIRTALFLLTGEDPLSLEQIGWLLRSPYVGGAQNEWLARAVADRTLRESGRCAWQLSALPKALDGVPRMSRVFGLLRDACRDSQRRRPGDWAEHFAQLLENCGWPGERGLTSREFQAVQHFKAALGQLVALDRVAQAMVRGEAVTILKRLTGEMIFQPEGGETRVQVMGMLEAAGLGFDALWLLGLHDGAFPAPARPNPFLPLSLQSRLRMPHADVLRQREFAERLARRLFAAALEVVVSWPAQRDDVSLRPSPLLRGVPAATLKLAPSCDPFRAVQSAECLLETFVDNQARPLPVGRPFSGGTRILADQALCPFRAFAHHRLHAEQLQVPDLGLDSMTRGTLVHGVMERFWRQVHDHETLLQLELPHQMELLAIAVEETLQQHERRSRNDLPKRLRTLEACRLAALAAGWLRLERQRPPFRVVALEQRHVAQVGRLQVRTRIDRIDELVDGQLAVFDYKTGRPNPRQWLDLRVTEPQLPLYCLDQDRARLAAVLFAVVRSRGSECAFMGVVRDPEAWPQLSPRSHDRLLSERGWISIGQVFDHWQAALTTLGNAFVDGCAAVDPVNFEQACASCDLVTLCRMTAGTLAARDSGDEGLGNE